MATVSQSVGQGPVLDLVQGKAGAIRELEVAGRARSRRGKGMGTEKEVLRVIRVQVRNALTLVTAGSLYEPAAITMLCSLHLMHDTTTHTPTGCGSCLSCGVQLHELSSID